jgi:predicted enzyme related to lactoylglutathione lyase
LLERATKIGHTNAMNKFASTRDIIIHTAEFDEAVRFYRDVLGLATTMNSEKLVGFETGAFQLFVDGRSPLRTGPVFEFCVADVGATKKKLLAAGCELVSEDASIPRCYIKDPHGLMFNLNPE